jgi:hypothetical protein
MSCADCGVNITGSLRRTLPVAVSRPQVPVIPALGRRSLVVSSARVEGAVNRPGRDREDSAAGRRLPGSGRSCRIRLRSSIRSRARTSCARSPGSMLSCSCLRVRVICSWTISSSSLHGAALFASVCPSGAAGRSAANRSASAVSLLRLRTSADFSANVRAFSFVMRGCGRLAGGSSTATASSTAVAAPWSWMIANCGTCSG